jgi:TrmH family RNA methyltransferase
MLSKNKIKYLQSLKNQKFREKYGKFIAEGDKLVRELINSDLIIEEIYSLKDWIDQTDIPSNINVTEIKPEELEKISNLKTPNKVVAVINIPSGENININFETDLILVLDQIKDPGNLGTIIRIADWFGIKNIVCSENTVEVYNPKVIQATMGSISRVKLIYKNLQEFFGTIPLNIPVYGSFLNGDNIYSSELTPNGLIIIGNESKGISDELNCFINKKITIPSFSVNKSAESLNASIATAIIISEFRRKHNKFISNQSFGN